MKADVLPIDGAEHQAVQLLLPWRGNALLSAAEAARVDAHVRQCPRCQADLAWQARLRLTGADVAPPGLAPIEQRWAALREQVSGDEARSRPAPRTVPRRSAPKGWSFAWGAQAGLLVALGIAAVWMLPGGVASYRGLAAAPASPAANAIVVFRPDASEAQIRAALRAAGAQLVGGPTVTDAYLLHLQQADQAALSALRGQAGVAQAESLVGGTAQ